MKHFLTLLACFICLQNFSQNKQDDLYFPREYLIHETCTDVENSSTCLYHILQEKTIKIVNKYYEFDDFKEDTLRIHFALDVDKRGKTEDFKIVNFYGLENNKPLRLKFKKLSAEIKEMIDGLPRFKVVNAKPSKYSSLHYFYYKYNKPVINNESSIKFILPKRIYTGGDIIEMPRAENCLKKTEYEDIRKCNSVYINKIIKDQFVYKNYIKKLEVSGKLSVRFKVDTLGNTIKIQTKGDQEDYIKDEVKRILNQMPNFTPVLVNGKKKVSKYIQFKIKFSE